MKNYILNVEQPGRRIDPDTLKEWGMIARLTGTILITLVLSWFVITGAGFLGGILYSAWSAGFVVGRNLF